MPSLIDIRRRIRAVKSTQQITKAMKMVAASRLRRAQEAMLNARPFARQLSRVLTSLATRVDPSAHPLLAQPEGKADAATLVIVITADKGMCGSFNANIIRAASQFMTGQPDRRRSSSSSSAGREPTSSGAAASRCSTRWSTSSRGSTTRTRRIIAKVAMDAFIGGEVEQRLPRVQRVQVGAAAARRHRAAAADPARGPERRGRDGAGGLPVRAVGRRQIFDELLPRHVEFQVYHALLESVAAENAAKMVAMDNATKNSAEVIDSLTLYLNKLRQAAITREIIEVVSGAGAL